MVEHCLVVSPGDKLLIAEGRVRQHRALLIEVGNNAAGKLFCILRDPLACCVQLGIGASNALDEGVLRPLVVLFVFIGGLEQSYRVRLLAYVTGLVGEPAFAFAKRISHC